MMAASQTLLALDAGLRETGWAVFREGKLLESGIIQSPRQREGDAASQVTRLLDCLNAQAQRWQPVAVAYREPTGLPWSLPALELLDAALREWSRRHRLALFGYTTQEIRQSIAGHPNVSHEQLAFVVMARLGLIGQNKLAREWEAIAVGGHHLSRWPQVLPGAS